MQYEIVAPSRPKRTFLSHVFELVLLAGLAAAITGTVAWSANQVSTLVTNHSTKTPRLISTSDEDVSCVIWRGQLSCFPNDEPMPEPEAELSYDEALELVKRSMAKPTT